MITRKTEETTDKLKITSRGEEWTYVHVVYREVLAMNGARGSVVVKALCYKQEGRGFDTR
jgi:hypothetical protein